MTTTRMTGGRSGVRGAGRGGPRGSRSPARPVPPLDAIRDRLRLRGLRWTPQRRTLVDVLTESRGHVTGAELVDRCRTRDPETTPSTVYRTLDVLEELGFVSHSHGLDGREEYHVLPERDHGHLHCTSCGRAWEIEPGEADGLVRTLARARGFEVDLSHVSIAGVCSECAAIASRR
jgi:Fur family transcriptional regulator, ferric uptake regulator